MSYHFDPQDEAFLANPYPTYERLREEAPVHFRELEDVDGQPVPIWTLSRWEDCVSLLRDARFSARKDSAKLFPAELDGLEATNLLLRVYNGMMLFRDPPDHTRLRNLVNKAFTPRVVHRLQPRIERLVDSLLEESAGRGRFDLVADLATPLPVVVIAELLGVPPEDHRRLKVWSDHVAMLIDGTLRNDHLEVALPSFLELAAYLKEIIDQRRKEPHDDLISGLVAAQEAEDALDDAEVLGTCLLVLGAGHETTTNLIGNGMLALLRDRAAWQRLADDPALAPSAVEELLRYDSPVQVTSRIPTEPFEIRGVTIPAGVEVNVLLGAANRDPRVFPEADRLVLERTDNRHLSFGHGAHFCLGAPLARLEAQVAIKAVIHRFPSLELDLEGDPPMRPGFVLRGRTALPVRA